MSRISTHHPFIVAVAALAVGAGWNFGVAAHRDAATAPAIGAEQSAGDAIDPSILKGLSWRGIGPDRGGRSIASSGVKGRPKEAYFGAVGGGLWKTTDSGAKWTPVTDGQITSSSVGAVAVSESNPDVVYIGTGESCIRGNIMPGDGVYKSTDAGKTWTHIGFADSDAISKIRIHPTNPDIVFVADFGRYGKDSDERGVFKSVDGGKTWKKVLFRNAKTGAVDIAIDRRNPSVVYAALWEAYRIEYQMSSGGPGSGLFKSTDGGDTWTEITHAPGLPSGIDGKITIGVSGGDSNRVYALVENEKGGLYRTDDAGGNWTLVNTSHSIRQRGFYFNHVIADPVDKDTVYMLNTSAFRSTDGGKTLHNIGSGTHGDHHDIWIDPDDAKHVVIANDGGGAVSYDVNAATPTWSPQDFPTGQFYHSITTKHVPYHVCGAQQDNTTMCVDSATNLPGGRGFGRGNVTPPYQVGGGEPGYIAPDPTNFDVIYAGANNGSFLTRLDRHTGELKEVGAYPRFFSGESSAHVKERWQWTYPIVFSPVDPKILYTSSQRVWKTTDGGQNWTAISGDLSRHDPKTMQDSGGPITHDMNSPEIYGTVFSIGPGKTDVNVVWAGSDDGLVQVTRDGGKTWTNVTPKDMPDFGRVSQIDASKFDAATAYVSVKKPLLEDYAPYIFRTHDFGRTWTRIVNGIAPNDYVSSVREDPTRKGLLYAGAEHGAYVSLDDGDHWQSLRLNMPDTQVSDIWVEANDLAISTMGRGFYILDNVAPLRQWQASVTTNEAFLFKPGDAIRGTPEGATISYLLKQQPQKLTLEILDAKGQVVRTWDGALPNAGRGGRGRGAAADTAPARAATAAAGGRGGTEAELPPDDEEEGRGRGGPQTAALTPGLNHFRWDLQYQPVVSFPGMVLWGATINGPIALPGAYQVRLTVDGQSQTQPLVVKKHPYHTATDADLQAQFDLASQIRDKVNEANNAVIEIRRIKQAVNDRLAKKDDADLRAIANRLTRNLTAIEEDVYQVQNQSNEDPLNFPIKINNRLASLLRVVETGDGRPTSNAAPIFDDIKVELKVQTDRLQQVMTTELPAFNRLVQRMGLDPVPDKQNK